MAEHRYTVEDRQRQLRQLVTRLSILINFLEETPEIREYVAPYAEARETASRLLKEGFTADDLKVLGAAVPDVFTRHPRDFEPPGRYRPDGTWEEVSWFKPLEERLQPALEAAHVLGFIGYY